MNIFVSPSEEEAEAARPEIELLDCEEYDNTWQRNLRGDHYCNDADGDAYHYHNVNGTFFHRQRNGYRYFNDGKGYHRIEDASKTLVRDYRIEPAVKAAPDSSEQPTPSTPSLSPRPKADPYPTPPPTDRREQAIVKTENSAADDALACNGTSPPSSPSPEGRLALPKLENDHEVSLACISEQGEGPSGTAFDTESKSPAGSRRRSRSPSAAETECTGPSQRARLAFSTPEPTPAPAAAVAHLYNSPPASPEKPLSTSQIAQQTIPRDTPPPKDQEFDAELPSTPRRSERIRTRSIALPPLTPVSPRDAQSPAKRRRSL